MKTMFGKILKTGLALSLVLLLLPIANINAAGKSIGLRPLKNDIKIDPGKTITRIITVVNNTKEEVTAVPVLEKFIASDSSGYPDQMIQGDPTNPQDATNWIELSEEMVTVPPFSTYDVEYAVKAPENAEPGGHYAAILFEPYDPDPVEGIKIQVRVASLLLINVAGDVEENAEISDFSLNSTKVYDDQNLTFDIGINNTGNVHFIPDGRIVLKNSKGEVISKIGKIINSDGQEEVFDYIPVNYKKSHVLPQSKRVFDGVWETPIYNEKIVAELKVAYSNTKELLNKTIEFILNRSLEILNFDFDLMSRKFDIVLKNKGTVLIKPVGAIKIYNSFDFQVDEIPLPENEEYLKQGEERAYTFVWDKEIPDGKYTAKYEHAGTLDNVKSEEIKFIIGNPFMAMLLGWQGIVAGIALLVIIIAFIFLLKKKKK